MKKILFPALLLLALASCNTQYYQICTLKSTTQGFSSAFYGEEISESLFLQVLDDSSHRGERSLEVMCHPAFIDNTIRQSAYCLPRLTELDVLTSASLKYAIAERGYRLGSYLDV